jgi:TetR/AcrR family transcriptional regulator
MRTTSLASAAKASHEGQPGARERILEAALTSFARDGYEGATMRDVARSARVPLGLLRYYFGGKLKLWQASVDSAFAEIQSGLEPPQGGARNDGDELSDVRAAIRAHVHYVARNPEFVRLMHDEGKRRGPRMRWIVDRHVSPMFARLIPMIRHLQGLGRLPDDIDPLHFVYSLIGAIDVIFHQAEECQRVTGVDPTDPAVVEAHARAVEFLLLGAPPLSSTASIAPTAAPTARDISGS